MRVIPFVWHLLARSNETAGRRSYRRGDLASAAVHFQRALGLSQRADAESAQVASALNWLGRVHFDCGELDAAERCFAEAAETERRRSIGTPQTPETIVVYNNLGRLHRARNRYQEAIRSYQRAHELTISTFGEGVESAAVLSNLGTVHEACGDLDQALWCFETAALTMVAAAAPASDTVACLANLAGIHHQQGRLDQAKAAYRQSLDICRTARLPMAGAAVLRNLGLVLLDLGEHDQALACLEASLQVRQAAAARSLDTAASHIALAWGYRTVGRLDQALSHAKAGCGLCEQLAPGTEEHATSLAAVAQVRHAAGDFAAALHGHRRALDIHRSVMPRSVGVAHDLNNIAIVYHDTGDLRRARRYYEQALRMQEEIRPASTSAASMRSNLGVVLLALGMTEEAVANYRTALDWDRRIAPRSAEVAIDLNNLGGALVRQGRVDQAITYFTQALEIDAESSGPDSLASAATMANLGWALARHGDLPAALGYAKRAVTIDRRLAPASDRLAADLVLLGDLLMTTGDLPAAIEHLTDAVTVVESLRARAADPEVSFADRHSAYRKLVVALSRRATGNDEAAAFEFADQAKARSLADLLGDQPHTPVPHTPEQRELVTAQRRLRWRIAAAQRSMPEVQLQGLLDEYDDVTDRIAASTASADPPAGPPTSMLHQVQRQVHADELLLAYFVSPDGVLAWTVTTQDLVMARLSITFDDLADLIDQATAGYRNGEHKGIDTAAARRDLAAALLPASLTQPRSEIRRVVVIPDGRLSYLPFEMLLIDGDTLMIDRWAMSYAPSAMALARLRAAGAVSRPRRLLGVGHPLLAQRSQADSDGEDPAYQAGLSEEVRLASIPGTRTEVHAIAALFGAEATTRTGAAATELMVRREAPAATLIHFATHGLLDDAEPLHSGIVLAPPTGDELAEAGDLDDLLQVYEIADLELDAELVVCSACQTGLGAIRAGEGPIGIARALFTAGTRGVVLSLWPVPDLPTRRLMVAFYTALRDGARPSAALRTAKQQVRARYQRLDDDPFVWAAFVVIGDG